MRKKITHVVIISVIIPVLLTIYTCPLQALTRGQMISEILDTLNIPVSANFSNFSDVPTNHPFFRHIETARAMGIIYPGERFHPDMEATVAETVFFALRTMGLEHEAMLIKHFRNYQRENIPLYINPYLTLSEIMDPPLPGDLMESMTEDLSEESLYRVVKWINKCKSNLQWELELGENPIKAVIFREGIGRPSGQWAIRIAEFEILENAQKELRKFISTGEKAYIEQDICSYAVYSGPFNHYESAWNKYQILNRKYDCSLVPASSFYSRALFWAGLRIDPRSIQPEIVTAPSISGYKLPLSWISEYTKADGAVNGGYYYRNRPVGSLVIDRTPSNSPLSYRSAFGWNSEGDLAFGNGNFRYQVKTDSGSVNVTAFNSPPSSNGASIYTPEFVNYATGIPKDSREFLVKEDLLYEIRDSLRSNHFVPRKGFMLISRGTATEKLNSLETGQKLDISINWADSKMADTTDVIQGGPMLIKDGILCLNNEGLPENFTHKPHPRTIVATDGYYLWFFVFDGRNPWHSRGVTLKEAGQILIDMGMLHALNLDGGGSTEMIWHNRIINMPSGGIERPLPYAVIIKGQGRS